MWWRLQGGRKKGERRIWSVELVWMLAAAVAAVLGAVYCSCSWFIMVFNKK